MKKDDYASEFIETLRKKRPRRAQLVRDISAILGIEPESASRRLSGSVNFSINEMLTLAKVFNISIDPLINKSSGMLWLPSMLDQPWQQDSIDYLADMLDLYFDKRRNLTQEPYTFTAVYDSLPLTFCMFYPELYKLFLFKWGHFFVNPNEFHDYTNWKVPQRFVEARKECNQLLLNNERSVFIWDDTLIFSLAKEVEYLCSLDVIDNNSKELIRNELHEMLSDMEKEFISTESNLMPKFGHEFYISRVRVGVNAWTINSKNGHAAFFSTHFSHTNITEDAECHSILSKWILSLKKISTQISGSGYKERRLFFKKQHEIVDWLSRVEAKSSSFSELTHLFPG